jgi:HK97 family phage major capsid protein
LLASIEVSTATFEYVQLTAPAPVAGVQLLEGDLKQQANISTGVQTANVATVAHFVRASQQVLDDAAALHVQLNNLLQYGCLNKLEALIAAGAGGPGTKGLLPSATAFVPTSTDAQDRIGEAVTALQAVGFVPSVIILNPVDWGRILRARGTTGDYLLGSPRDPAGPSLWSTSVVTSASLAAGTALVMDASQVCLLDRQSVVVQISIEDADNFQRNMVTVRAELRAGLAVFSPAAVLSLSLTD